MRVALLTNILTPYRVPVYRALADTYGMQWRIFTNARTEFDRTWSVTGHGLDVEAVKSVSFRRRFAFGGREARQLVTTYIPIGLLGSLRRFAPDVVVSSELGARTLLALLYCRLFSVPLVIWSYHSRVSSTASTGALQTLRRWLLARASAVVGMGVQAREVLRSLDVPNERIFDAPNAHDADGLRAARQQTRGDGLRLQLTERGARDRIALIVGRLVAAKGISPLLENWDDLPPDVRNRWTLLFVGDGPLEADLYRRIENRERGEVLHAASVSAERLVDYYTVADLMVFPSLGDPWGLVVNEALACGLPVVCSSRAGCSDDMVRPGKNGWVADPTRPEEWTAAMLEALTHPALEQFAAPARQIADQFGPRAMADGILAAVRSTLGARATRSMGSRQPGVDLYS